VYVAPEGNRGWIILEMEDEEDLRHTVGYQATGTEGSESLEDMWDAFNRLSDQLDRMART